MAFHHWKSIAESHGKRVISSAKRRDSAVMSLVPCGRNAFAASGSGFRREPCDPEHRVWLAGMFGKTFRGFVGVSPHEMQ